MSQLRNSWLTLPAMILVAGLTVPSKVKSADGFPPADQETHVSAEAVKLFAAYVHDLVESGAVVGAETHVIVDGKTVLHEAHGWADREARERLQKNAVFCVRSMTKPLGGTAIQILIDEGKLQANQPAAGLLPSFNRDDKAEITIKHLLEHRSGLPFSAIDGPTSKYKSLGDVARGAAAAKLQFKPGEDFQYSDAGSDTLGAVIESVTGNATTSFIRRRVLQPLGMRESMLLISDSDGLRARVPSAYSGGPGGWQRHWRRTDPPILSLFLTSQGLFCTTTDYARFLHLWMNDGQFQGKRLLTAAAIARGLSPVSPMREYPSGFVGAELFYGQQWMVWRDRESGELFAFGHNGSDGTHAWAFPEQKMVVLFFTQSRGTTAGVDLEPVIDQLLIRGDVDGYRRAKTAREMARKQLARLEGIYWDEGADDGYYVIKAEEEKLFVERPGRLRMEASPGRKPGEFTIAGGSLRLNFEPGEPRAPAVVMTSFSGSERQVRHQPSDDLPSLEKVLAQVAAAHGMANLQHVGVIQLDGSMRAGLLGRKGRIQQWFDSTRLRSEVRFGETVATVVVDGQQAAASEGGPLKPLDGAMGRQEVVGHPAIHYGQWRRGYQQLQVLRRIERDGKHHLLIRAANKNTPTTTLIVDAESGRLIGEQGLVFVAGAGVLGVETQYDDFRSVAGLQLPMRIESKFANPLLGKVVIQFDKVTTGLEPGERFKLPSGEPQ